MSQRRFLTFAVIFAMLAFTAGCGQQAAGNKAVDLSSKPLIKPPSNTQAPKIIAFGDSLTAGFGLSETESYPYLLQEKLRADGYPHEVINAGVSGDTSLGGLERVDWVLEQENVRILILELGANDLLRGMPPGKMKENLGKIIKKAKERNIEVLLCGMLAPAEVGENYQREFVRAFPDLAKENKVALLPFILENVAMIKELNQADGIHPNAEGTKLMTDNVYKALIPLITSST